MFGAGLDVKFWPYAFIHVLRIQNALPGQGQDASPLFLSTGRKDNFRNLRIFGCRVWVQPNGIQKKRFKHDVRNESPWVMFLILTASLCIMIVVQNRLKSLLIVSLMKISMIYLQNLSHLVFNS